MNHAAWFNWYTRPTQKWYTSTMPMKFSDFFAPKMNLTNLESMEISIVFKDFWRYYSNETHFLYYTDYHTQKIIWNMRHLRCPFFITALETWYFFYILSYALTAEMKLRESLYWRSPKELVPVSWYFHFIFVTNPIQPIF